MNDSAHLLVVDDDAEIRREIREYFSAKGFRVSTADGGVAMRRILERDPAQIIILDLTMPGDDGLTLASAVRKTSNVGIIILTGTGDEVDRVVGLELGADHFVSKPCDLRELLARVRSTLRRVSGGGGGGPGEALAKLVFDGWTLDRGRRQLISPDGTDVALTTAEFDLLAGFASSGNRVLNRDQLLDIVHDRQWSPFDRSVDNLISRLRRKIEADPKHPLFIKTIRGVGYMFTPKVEDM